MSTECKVHPTLLLQHRFRQPDTYSVTLNPIYLATFLLFSSNVRITISVSKLAYTTIHGYNIWTSTIHLAEITDIYREVWYEVGM